MKRWLLSLFSEDSRVSAMRVMSMMALVTAIAIGVIGVCRVAPDYSGLSLLCSTFLAVAFGGKAVQKVVENRQDKN